MSYRSLSQSKKSILKQGQKLVMAWQSIIQMMAACLLAKKKKWKLREENIMRVLRNNDDNYENYLVILFTGLWTGEALQAAEISLGAREGAFGWPHSFDTNSGLLVFFNFFKIDFAFFSFKSVISDGLTNCH